VGAASIELHALAGIPAVREGDDLAALVEQALSRAQLQLRSGDILVFAQKVVSKAEGRLVDLASVAPGPQALIVAEEVQKDPRVVELILSEARRIVRKRPGLLIVEHRLGFIMANAGLDQSNTTTPDGREYALLLPIDPDASARVLRARLESRHVHGLGVVINDSFGRPWRRGTVGVALGASGLAALLDLRETPDLFGRTLKTTIVAHADEIAAAASLVMGQADEGRPVVLVRGARPASPRGQADVPARDLLRPPEEDLFR
jgi:coenzyme F420-0:L-glutamate ligase / coenzyme F420-1:gamma-L-glutamate ligase